MALAPVLLELLIWAGHQQDTAAPRSFISHLDENRDDILAETYRRWEQRDSSPVIPPFNLPVKARKGRTKR